MEWGYNLIKRYRGFETFMFSRDGAIGERSNSVMSYVKKVLIYMLTTFGSIWANKIFWQGEYNAS